MATTREPLAVARALFALAALALALAAWFAWPTAFGPARARGVRAVLVDVSASVVRARPDWPAWRDAELAAQAQAAAQAGEELFVACFARGFERSFGPAPAEEWSAAASRESALSDERSELAGALTALASALERRALVHLTLLGDGGFDGPDPRPALDRWRASGARWEWRAPPPPSRVDLAIEELRAPRELELGAPLALAARVRSLAAAPTERARLVVELEDRAGRRSVQRWIDAERFAAGEVVLTLDVGPLAEGLTRLEARVEAAGDPSPENDRRRASVRSRGALVVGVLDERGRAARWLASARQLAGLDVRALDVGDSLDGFDVFVSVDADPAQLDAARVREFVRRGGGWLACGGPRLAAALARAPQPGELAELAPLEAQAAPERDVVLLLDGSGSMGPAELESVRRASSELAARAAADERIQAQWFTDRLLEAFELAPGPTSQARSTNAARWAAAQAPRGPTDVVRVLEELAERRSGARAALVFLITDGRDQRARWPDAAALQARVEALAARGVRLAVIAAGEGADRAWLDELARATAHGRAWTEGEAELADALAAEASREWIAREGGAVLAAPAPAPDVAALVAAWGAAEQLPAAGTHWRARLRAGGELVLALEGGDPLFALRRHGGGWCAVWSSEPGAWSPGWDDARALAPLVRWLGREHAQSGRLALRAVREAGAWRLEDCPVSWPAEVWIADVERPDERARARQPAEAGARDPRSLREAAPGAAAGARALLVLDEAGALLAQVDTDGVPAPEFAGARGSVLEPALAPLGPAGEGQAAAGARRRWAVFALAAAGLALSLGLLFGARSGARAAGQVLPGPGR